MSPEDYRAALKALCLTQHGAAAVLGVSRRAGHDFATRGPTPPAALAIRLLLALDPEARAPFLTEDNRTTHGRSAI